MKRKVSRIGASTLMVSLPSKWCKAYNVKKGDEIELQEDNGNLLLQLQYQAEGKRARIDARQMEKLNTNFITGAYQLGYDELEILFRNDQDFQDIQKAIQSCIGYEIVNVGEKHCTIKDISQSSNIEFNSILRRTFLLLLQMAESCHDALQKQEFGRLQDIRLLESSNNRFTDYCKRVLNKHHYPDKGKTNIMYCLIRDLEKMADEYKRICDNIKTVVDKPFLKLFAEVNQVLRLFYEQFYSFDNQATEQALKKAKHLGSTILQHLSKSEKEDTLFLHFLHTLVVRTYDGLITNIKLHYKPEAI